MQNLEDKRQSSGSASGHAESGVAMLPSDITFALNNELNYLKKKIENIGIALYLIADKIKDNSDVKANVKHASSDLLVNASSLIRHSYNQDSSKTESDAYSAGFDGCLKAILGSLSLALSHIKIGYLTQAISAMNFSLVQQQLVEIMGHVDQMINVGSAEELKSQLKQVEFFSHAKWPSQPRVSRSSAANIHKGQHIGHNNEVSYMESEHNKKTPAPINVLREFDLKDRKENRKSAIIALLSTKSNLTVRDFLSVITDCSEKTIQRELIDLVSLGILKKEGERRWSRYSLPTSAPEKAQL